MKFLSLFETPSVWYHGTSTPTADARWVWKPHDKLGRPFVAYFTPDFATAWDFAEMNASTDGDVPLVVEARLLLGKTVIMADHMHMQDLHSLPEKVRKLQKQGYDSATYEGAEEIAVFDPARHAQIMRIIRQPQKFFTQSL